MQRCRYSSDDRSDDEDRAFRPCRATHRSGWRSPENNTWPFRDRRARSSMPDSKQVLENPRAPLGGYDERTDQWTTVYGDGAGLIV